MHLTDFALAKALTQTFELHPVPSVVLLPLSHRTIHRRTPSSFRLYFLCQCSDNVERQHDASIASIKQSINDTTSNVPSTSPSSMDHMLFAIPPSLCHNRQSIQTDALDQPSSSLEQLSDTLEPELNQFMASKKPLPMETMLSMAFGAHRRQLGPGMTPVLVGWISS